MGSVTYLRPAMGRREAERLLADVEAAVAAGRHLGDRRCVLGDIILGLQRSQAHLLDVIEGLRVERPSQDPTLAAQIVCLDETCSMLHTNISIMIRKANRLITS